MGVRQTWGLVRFVVGGSCEVMPQEEEQVIISQHIHGLSSLMTGPRALSCWAHHMDRVIAGARNGSALNNMAHVYSIVCRLQ